MLLQEDAVQVGRGGLLGGGATWQDLALGAGLGLLSANGDPRGLMQGLSFGNQLGTGRQIAAMRGLQAQKLQEETMLKRKQQAEFEAAVSRLAPPVQAAVRAQPALLGDYMKTRGGLQPLLPAEQVAQALQGAEPGSPLATALSSELNAAGVKDGFRFTPDGAVPVAGGPADPAYQAGLTGAKTTAQQRAEMPFVGPRAGAEAAARLPSQQSLAAFNANLDIAKANAIPREVAPSATLVRGGAGGAPVEQVYGNPNAVQENAFSAGIGKDQVELITETRTAANQAAQALPSLLSQKNLIDKGFQTGFGTQTRAYVSTALQGVGVSEGMANALTRGDPAALRLFQANANEIVQQVAKSLGANPTDNDARLLAQTIAQASDAPSAAKAIIDYKIGREQRKVDKWKGLYEWTLVQKKDPMLFDVEWQQKSAQGAGLPGNAADLSKLSNEEVLQRLGIR